MYKSEKKKLEKFIADFTKKIKKILVEKNLTRIEKAGDDFYVLCFENGTKFRLMTRIPELVASIEYHSLFISEP